MKTVAIGKADKTQTTLFATDDVYVVEKPSDPTSCRLHFHPVNSDSQRRWCEHLGLHYHRANHFGLGGPEHLLTLPNLRTLR